MSKEKYEVNVRPEKVTVVEEMKEKLGYQGVVLVTFNKLDVKNATLLRRKFLAHGVEYKVIKNTLTRIAAVCKDDPVAPAAALKEFLAETKSEAVVVKAGLLDGKVIDAKGVQALADLPSREQLLGMVAATLQAPIAGLARALNANIQKFAYAIEAVRKQKESA